MKRCESLMWIHILIFLNYVLMHILIILFFIFIDVSIILYYIICKLNYSNYITSTKVTKVAINSLKYYFYFLFSTKLVN